MTALRTLARPGVAVGLCVLLVVIVALTIPIDLAQHHGPAGSSSLVTAVVFGVIGTVVVTKRPMNVVGWLVLGAGLFTALNDIGSAYNVLDYRVHHGTWPLGAVSLLVQPSWSPTILCGAAGIMLFPDGRPPGRASKWALSVSLVLGALWFAGAYGIVISTLVDHSVGMTASGDLVQIDNPTGFFASWSVVQDVFFFSVAVAELVWVVQAVGRYRRATTEARAQQKWLFAGAVVAIVSGPLTIIFGNATSGWHLFVSTAGTLLICAVPLSIAIGILKFHLYDIDRVISRSISYLAVTGLVVGGYVGLVILGTRVLSFSSPVAVATSTLLLVIAFNPLRKRLQRVVDRRFNRARYDAEALVASFAGRLKDSVDTSTVQRQFVDAVGQALEPERVFIWLNTESRR